MTTYGTLCYIKNNGKILLQKKAKKLFGGDKWNAPGGKIAEGETPEQGVMREIHEETGLTIYDPINRGTLIFHTPEQKDPVWLVHVFETEKYSGELKQDYREGKLEWVDETKLPFDQMWEDDKYWLPLMLKQKNFEGKFYFTEGLEKMVSHGVKTLD